MGEKGGDGVIDTFPVEPPLQAYPGYRLEATGRETAEDERLKLLEQVFDPGSRQRRELVRPGWRCLEAGAGRGSMAAWLAGRVGPGGQVVAIESMWDIWLGSMCPTWWCVDTTFSTTRSRSSTRDRSMWSVPG